MYPNGSPLLSGLSFKFSAVQLPLRYPPANIGCGQIFDEVSNQKRKNSHGESRALWDKQTKSYRPTAQRNRPPDYGGEPGLPKALSPAAVR